MSEANAKTFFDYLDNSLATSTMKTNAYTYALDSLERVGWLTSAHIVASSATDFNIAFPTAAVRLLSVFYDDHQCSRETRETLRLLGGEGWRDHLGIPIAYTEYAEPDRNFRPFPRPDLSNSALSYPNSEPFGRDYPTNAFVLFTSDRTDPPTWLDVPTALLMVAYARSLESASQDLDAANACEAVAQTLIGIIANA